MSAPRAYRKDDACPWSSEGIGIALVNEDGEISKSRTGVSLSEV